MTLCLWKTWTVNYMFFNYVNNGIISQDNVFFPICNILSKDVIAW